MQTRRLGEGWRIAIDPDDRGRRDGWFAAVRPEAREARVPGVIQEAFPRYHGLAWYWTLFTVPEPLETGRRCHLRVGSVDYAATVWVNGVEVAVQQGSHSPFSADVTPQLAAPGAANLVAIRVLNPTDRRMLNETREGPVFREAVAALQPLRDLDPTRLVLLSSGRWDGDPEVGSVANPGERPWSRVWGAEGEGGEVRPAIWDRDTGGYLRDAGDAHLYPAVPHTETAERLLRTMGEGTRPVFLSEYGVGSLFNAVEELAGYEQNGAPQELVLVGGDVGDDRAALAGRLRAATEAGATVALLAPQQLVDGENRLLPLPGVTCTPVHDWLYHSECVGFRHPLFAGLQTGGILDWYLYGQTIPRHLLGGAEPVEIAAAGITVGQVIRGGYRGGLSAAGYELGRGRLLVSAFRILEELNRNPCADRMLMNIIEHARPQIGRASGAAAAPGSEGKGE